MYGEGSVDRRDTDTAVDEYLRRAAASSDNWQDFLVRLAHHVRRTALTQPEAFPLLPATPSEAPRVRPLLRSLRWMETFLDILLSYGFDDDAAVAAYRAYSTFLLSQLLIEGSARRPVDAVPDAAAVGDLTDFPHVHRLREKLAQDHSLGEFEDALEALLDRLGRTTDAIAFDVEVGVPHRKLSDVTFSEAEPGATDGSHPSATTIDIQLDTLEKAAVLRVSGEIDIITAPLLREAIERAWATGRRATIVDLTAVTFLASNGLAVLAAGTRTAPEGTRLLVVADSSATVRPIEVTGLTELLDLYRTEDAALATL